MDAKLKGNKVGKRKHWKKQEKLIPWGGGESDFSFRSFHYNNL